MDIDYLAFELDRDDWEGPEFHRFYHFMFRIQSNCFATFLGHELKCAETASAVGKSPAGIVIILRDLTKGALRPPRQNEHGIWLLEEGIDLDEMAAIPFEIAERASGQDARIWNPSLSPADWTGQKHSDAELHALLHRLTLRTFCRWQDLIGIEPKRITEIYHKFLAAGQKYDWIQATGKRTIKAINAKAELVNEMTSWAVTRRLVIFRKAEVLDSCIVGIDSPERQFLNRFSVRLRFVDGEITIGNGTVRYRPFGPLRRVGFNFDGIGFASETIGTKRP